MDFNYLGYNEAKQIVKGTISATSEKAAEEILTHDGYRIINLKPVASFAPNWRTMFPSLFRIKLDVITMFSRQLALLLESGINIVQALELLGEQTSNRTLKRVLSEVVTDLRSGNQLSAALSKHPESFSAMYCRSLNVGEQTGSLEIVLRQMADYMEKEATAAKEVKNALKYPVIIAIVAAVVIGVIVTFVLPAFANLYTVLEVELPPMTRALISATTWLNNNGLYLFGGILIASFLGYVYIRTPGGKLSWDRLSLRLPLLGHIRRLDELAHCCRAMSLLVQSGLPMPEVMSLVVDSSDNRAVKAVLTDVRRDMLKGEGLSRPMAKHRLFLPLMVAMVKVGEETGNIDVTLTAVAQAFETEASDKMRAFIGMIQPAVTLIIGIVVAFICLSLISAMYSMYGQVT